MKYLAVLRDSVRESIDTWVLYVLLGLSGLLILAIGSLSFRPLSVEEDVDQFVKGMNSVFGLQRSQGMAAPELSHSEVKQLNPDVEPLKGNYEFDVAVEWPDEKKRHQQFSPMVFRFILAQGFGSYLDHIQVTEVKAENAKESRFKVTSEGTKIDNLRGWKHEPSLFFGLVPLRFGPVRFGAPLSAQVYFIEDKLVNGIGAWVGVLIGIVVTSFFIPNMLRKGTIDLLLVKPMHRVTLLIFKYIGGLSFMLFTATVTVGGIWLVLGLRTGIWASGFLLTILVLTFFFAIYYSVSTLFGVLTHSPIVAILMTVLVWGVLYAVGWVYSEFHKDNKPLSVFEMAARAERGEESPLQPDTRMFPEWVDTAVDTIHYVTPRTGDLDALTSRLLEKDILLADNPRLKEQEKTPFSWGESLTVSGIFIAIMLGLACLRFATKDY
jgi:hypothetical protein